MTCVLPSRLFACIVAIGVQPCCIGSSAQAQSASSAQRQLHADHVARAAARFGIPEQWIWAVMARESGGNPDAISTAGARGLMQVMPATWADLRVRHGLGPDPYDPRDNIMAGAAYLREMHDRYGTAGMLAAYNAGPRRYEEYLRGGRPLPVETRAYLDHLLPRLAGLRPGTQGAAALPAEIPWTQALLFVRPFISASSRGDDPNVAAGAGSSGVPSNDTPSLPARPSVTTRAGQHDAGNAGLFVIRTRSHP